jgi:hypothetical protein
MIEISPNLFTTIELARFEFQRQQLPEEEKDKIAYTLESLTSLIEQHTQLT